MRTAGSGSSLEHILKALLPYSRENLQLSFKPNKFFDELEHVSHKKRTALQSALSRAISKGYIERIDGVPCLTEKGRRRIRPFTAKRLQHNVFLMVCFDIPENFREKRRKLRSFLQTHEFQQAQKSIWLSKMDYRDELKMLCEDLQIEDYVDMYECAKA